MCIYACLFDYGCMSALAGIGSDCVCVCVGRQWVRAMKGLVVGMDSMLTQR